MCTHGAEKKAGQHYQGAEKKVINREFDIAMNSYPVCCYIVKI